MDDAISRLRERAQNEATCFALNDECKHLRQQLAECQRERDELVAACKETIAEAGQMLADNCGRNCEADYNRCYSMVYRNLDPTLAKLGANKTGEK